MSIVLNPIYVSLRQDLPVLTHTFRDVIKDWMDGGLWKTTFCDAYNLSHIQKNIVPDLQKLHLRGYQGIGSKVTYFEGLPTYRNRLLIAKFWKFLNYNGFTITLKLVRARGIFNEALHDAEGLLHNLSDGGIQRLSQESGKPLGTI